MSDEIKPALTPKEWEKTRANVRDNDAAVFYSARSPHFDYDGVFVWDGGEESERINPALLPAAIALCNYALPAGHPLKITGEDVAAIHQLLDRLEYEGGFLYENPVRAIAAKLSALLPPKET